MNIGSYKVSCCGHAGNSLNTPVKEIPEPHSFQDITSLHYCNKCNSTRCTRCSTTRIVIKYCPRCMKSASKSLFHCNGNCFVCPICDGYLRVSSKTKANKEDMTKVEGKSFQLKCRQCSWQYSTGFVSKPQLLARILEDQRNSNGKNEETFTKLLDYYNKRKQVLQFLNGTDMERSMMKISLLKDFSALEIAKLNKMKTVDEFFNAVNLNPMISNKEIVDNPEEPGRAFPKKQLLRCKVMQCCKKCKETITCPSSDPSSIKFSSKNSLNDFFPRISLNSPRRNGKPSSLKLQKGTNCILVSFKNFQKENVDVTLSTFEKFDRNLRPIHTDKESEEGTRYSITIPCSQFTLGSIPQKLSDPELIVKTIPTVELTEFTKISKVELFKRNHDSVRRISVDPKDESDDLGLSLMNLKDSVEIKPLDCGINWCTIMIKLCIVESEDADVHQNVELPLYMTIKSKASSVSIGSWIKLPLGPITK